MNNFLSVVIVCLFITFFLTSGCTEENDSKNDQYTQIIESMNDSQEYYDRLVVTAPNDSVAWCTRGLFYNNYLSQNVITLECANRSLELNPEYGLAWFLKGIAYMNLESYQEAESCFKNATKYDPELTIYVPYIKQS